MELEEWLEKTMVMANNSLRLMPARVLRQYIDSCRAEGRSLASIAGCCSHLGYCGRSRLLELKRRVPQPPAILSPEQIRLYKEANQARVEGARSLINCLLVATREAPVTAGLQRLDEKPIMRAEEVQQMLDVGRNTIYDWCQRNIIPHRRAGRLVLFSRKRIKEWLENEHGGGNQQ